MKIDDKPAHAAFDLSSPGVRCVGYNGIVTTAAEAAARRVYCPSSRPDPSCLATLRSPFHAEWWAASIKRQKLELAMRPRDPRRALAPALQLAADARLRPAAGRAESSSALAINHKQCSLANVISRWPEPQLPQAPSAPKVAWKPALDQARPKSAPSPRARRQGHAFGRGAHSLQPQEVAILPAEVPVVPSVVERVRNGARAELTASEAKRRLAAVRTQIVGDGGRSWEIVGDGAPTRRPSTAPQMRPGSRSSRSRGSHPPIPSDNDGYPDELDMGFDPTRTSQAAFATRQLSHAAAAQEVINELDAMHASFSFAHKCIEEELDSSTLLDPPMVRLAPTRLARQDPATHLERPTSTWASGVPRTTIEQKGKVEVNLQALRTLVKAIDIAASRWDAMP